MSICTFLDTYGYPPDDCAALKQWLWELVQQLSESNSIRCGEAASDPSDSDLEDLWGTCPVPTGSLVAWYNTNTTDTTYWICVGTGTCIWMEFILT